MLRSSLSRWEASFKEINISICIFQIEKISGQNLLSKNLVNSELRRIVSVVLEREIYLIRVQLQFFFFQLILLYGEGDEMLRTKRTNHFQKFF